MKLFFIMSTMVLILLLTGCSGTPTTQNTLPEDANFSESLQEDYINDTTTIEETSTSQVIDEIINDTTEIIEQSPRECVREIFSLVNNLTESPSGGRSLKLSRNNLIYNFNYQVEGLFYIESTESKNNPPLIRVILPTGSYAFKNPVLIDDFTAIKILNKTYSRITNVYYNETLEFELYNISDDCIAPEMEERQIVTVNCGGTKPAGDCIGSQYDQYIISINAWNKKNDSKFELRAKFDGGETILPTYGPTTLFGNFYVQYKIPPYTFNPGTHIITLEIETSEGVVFKENYKIIILPDNKVSVRKYTVAYICDTDEPVDFIRYYDTVEKGMLLKHNYYPANFTLGTGECIAIPGGFNVCDNGETFYGSYDNKILTLMNAKSVCPWINPASDECRKSDTLEIGDSFENRFRQEYELVEIYKNPKLVLLKQLDKKWLIYYPYDVNADYWNEIIITSAQSNSIIVSHLDNSC